MESVHEEDRMMHKVDVSWILPPYGRLKDDESRCGE